MCHSVSLDWEEWYIYIYIIYFEWRLDIDAFMTENNVHTAQSIFLKGKTQRGIW